MLRVAGWVLIGAMAGCATQGRSLVVRDSHGSRYASLETPATLPTGSVALMGSGGFDYHRDGYFDKADVKVSRAGGGGRVRVGVFEGVEMQAEGAANRWRINSSLCEDEDERDHLDSGLYTGRGGFKFSPRATRDFFAVTTGVGGGSSRAGTFLSPDIGVVFGYEKGPVVPFAHLELAGALPLARREVLGLDCSRDDQRLTVDVEPVNRVQGRATLGLAVPRPEAFNGRRHFLTSFYFATNLQVSQFVTGGLSAGIEFTFGRRPARPSAKPKARPAPQPKPEPPSKPLPPTRSESSPAPASAAAPPPETSSAPPPASKNTPSSDAAPQAQPSSAPPPTSETTPSSDAAPRAQPSSTLAAIAGTVPLPDASRAEAAISEPALRSPSAAAPQ